MFCQLGLVNSTVCAVLPRMKSDDLKTWQAAKINKALFPLVNYLGRLYFRMEKVGFLPDDPLYILVRNAYHAVLSLSHELHYMSCKSGVGRDPRE
jgi:hypothetical protein